MAGNAERTYLVIKPDGVQRGLVGQIVQRFEARGYKLVRSSQHPQCKYYLRLCDRQTQDKRQVMTIAFLTRFRPA